MKHNIASLNIFLKSKNTSTGKQRYFFLINVVMIVNTYWHDMAEVSIKAIIFISNRPIELNLPLKIQLIFALGKFISSYKQYVFSKTTTHESKFIVTKAILIENN